jgi:hypothetical protein
MYSCGIQVKCAKYTRSEPAGGEPAGVAWTWCCEVSRIGPRTVGGLLTRRAVPRPHPRCLCVLCAVRSPASRSAACRRGLLCPRVPPTRSSVGSALVDEHTLTAVQVSPRHSRPTQTPARSTSASAPTATATASPMCCRVSRRCVRSPRTTLSSSISQAEERITAANVDKEYLPITGLADFTKLAAKLAYGADSAPITEGRVSAPRILGSTAQLLCRSL